MDHPTEFSDSIVYFQTDLKRSICICILELRVIKFLIVLTLGKNDDRFAKTEELWSK